MADQPTIGVLTVVRDDRPLAPGWFSYWQRAVGADNVIVFDDASIPIDDLDCTVHRLPTAGTADESGDGRIGLLNGFAAGLGAAYEWMLAVRPSEILVPDPDEFDGFTGYLTARAELKAVAPVALRPLDTSGLAMFVPALCRPVLKRVAAPWSADGNGIATRYAVDPALFLIDLAGPGEQAVPADPAGVPEFRPADEPLARFVADDGADGFRVPAEPVAPRLVRLPERLRSQVTDHR